MANSVSGVERNDIATGKLARAFSGAFDILANGFNAVNGGKRPCRAIVANGAVTFTGIDGVDVDLPDAGGVYEWPVQAMAIVSGDGVVLY